MPELTREERRAEYATMDACASCQTFSRASQALHDVLDAGLMELAAWGTASHEVYSAEQHHVASVHPRYFAHIAALAEKRGAEVVARFKGGERV